MAATYEPISTTTVASATLDVTFSSIPATYTDLVLVCGYARSAGGNNISMRFNGDSGSNYSVTFAEHDGSAVSYGRYTNQSLVRSAFIGGGTSTAQSTLIIHIQNYASTNTYKQILSEYGETSSVVGLSTASWWSTSAINSLTIGLSGTVNWNVGSVLTLYGIKAA